MTVSQSNLFLGITLICRKLPDGAVQAPGAICRRLIQLYINNYILSNSSLLFANSAKNTSAIILINVSVVAYESFDLQKC